MTTRSRKFILIVYEPHLIGKLENTIKLLDKYGKYFYIRHSNEDITPHYHIYFESKERTTPKEIAALFEKFISNRVFVEIPPCSKKIYVNYFLEGDTYTTADIVTTMSLK